MRKNVKNVILTLLVLTISVSIIFLAYAHFASSEEALSGEWTAKLDMTEQAAVTALGWLQEIEAVSVSLEDMAAYMQTRRLTVQVNMTLEQTGRSEGTFHCNVEPESYEACRQAAYEAFAMAFRALLTERLHMAGYTKGTDDEAIEALVEETFGMSTVSYLMSCGPALLPSLEELQARYDGSGTYLASEGVLTRQFDTGRPVATIAECYIRKDADLVLSEAAGSVTIGLFADDYPILYTLVQSE